LLNNFFLFISSVLSIIGDFFLNLGYLIINLSKIFKNKKKFILFFIFLPISFLYFSYITVFIFINTLFYFIKFYFYKYKSKKQHCILTINLNIFEIKNIWSYYFINIFIIFPNILSYIILYKSLEIKKKSNFFDKYNIYINNFIIFNLKRILTFITTIPLSVFKINVILTNTFYDFYILNWSSIFAVIFNTLFSLISLIKNNYKIFYNYKIILDRGDVKFNGIEKLPVKFTNNFIKSNLELYPDCRTGLFSNKVGSEKNPQIVTHLSRFIHLDNNTVLQVNETTRPHPFFKNKKNIWEKTSNILQIEGTINENKIAYNTPPIISEKNELMLKTPSNIDFLSNMELINNDFNIFIILMLEYNGVLLETKNGYIQTHSKYNNLKSWVDDKNNDISNSFKNFFYEVNEFNENNKEFLDLVDNLKKEQKFEKLYDITKHFRESYSKAVWNFNEINKLNEINLDDNKD